MQLFKRGVPDNDEAVRIFFSPSDLEGAFKDYNKDVVSSEVIPNTETMVDVARNGGGPELDEQAVKNEKKFISEALELCNAAHTLHENQTPISIEMLHEIVRLSKTPEEIMGLDELPNDLMVELNNQNLTTLGELRDRYKTKSEEENKLNALFQTAESREDLESIIKTSSLLKEGLIGSKDVYSREDLLVLIDAIWKGEIALDHLTNTAGFRENVYRIMRRNQDEDNIPKPKSWDEMKDTVPRHNHSEKNLPTNYIDNEGDLVHLYNPKKLIQPHHIEK